MVRVATRHDAADVARLLEEFRAWYGKAEGEPMLPVVERLLDEPQTEYLLAGEGPDAVAQVRYRLSVWTGTEDCWLEDLFVAERARGTGLGRALAQAVLDRARERGCRRVELDVDVANAPARALYEALGFRDKTEGGTLFLQRWL